MSAAAYLEPPSGAAEQRVAMLHALPLRAEPPTPEEDAIFEEIEAELSQPRPVPGSPSPR